MKHRKSVISYQLSVIGRPRTENRKPIAISIPLQAICISLVCLLIAFIVYSMANTTEGWMAYRHDKAQSGITPEKVATPLSLQWTFKPTHIPKPAWSKPAEEMPRTHFDNAYHVAVANGKVYFGSSVDNKVYAIDAKTGNIHWQFFTEGPVRFAPTVWKERVYVGSDDGYVYCLKANNGKLIWRFRAGTSDEKIIGNGRMISLWPVRTSVLVDNGAVYFGAGVFPYEGIYVYALNADDGMVIWKNDTAGGHSHELAYGGISPQGYLVASENILYVPSGRAMPAAFDRKTGQFLYYCSPGSKAGGTWTLLAGDELIAGVEREGTPAKVAYDGKTGSIKGDAYAWFPGLDLIVTNEFSYSLTKDGIYAIDRVEYPIIIEKLNAVREERQKLSGMLLDLKRKLPEADDDPNMGIDYIIRMHAAICQQIDEVTLKISKLAEEEKQLKTSIRKWEYLNMNLSSLILAGDVLFAGGEGMVVALDARVGKELWQDRVDGKAYGLAASNGSLFVSTDRGPIYCFGEGKIPQVEDVKADINVRSYPEDKLTAIYEAAAEAILQETGVEGELYCLVLNCGTGRLAYELARRTELKIIGIEDDPKKIEIAKRSLDAEGLYGSRVVVEQWELSSLPDYFANLIVSDKMIMSGKLDAPAEEIFRVLRPCGGVAYIPDTGYRPPDAGYNYRESKILPTSFTKGRKGHLVIATRRKLEGAGSWTQHYANPQNTACSDDELVKGPLGVLWFGEPGPYRMVDRDGRVASPVSIDGRLFVQGQGQEVIKGQEVIMAYDAYNGAFLWEREMPGAIRVRSDVDAGNMAITSDSLYVAAGSKCYRLDPATGKTMQVYEVPAGTLTDSGSSRWGYITCTGEILFGSTAMPLKAEYASLWNDLVQDEGTWKSVEQVSPQYKTFYEYFTSRYPVPDENARAAFHRSGMLWYSMGDYPIVGPVPRMPKGAVTERMIVSSSIFAMDTKTGKLLWLHSGNRIANISVTIGNGAIFFTESSVTDEHREKALKDRQELVKRGIYEEGDEANLHEDADVRLVVSLDAATGKKLWEKPLDLTGCGGDRLCTAYHDGVLLCFGQFGNHDSQLFKEGSLKWRRINALSAETGDVLWSRPLNYLRRPLIVGDTIVIEPRVCDVRTGKIKMRTHPITGEQVPWEFLRPGHSCGITSASANCLFYRSYSTAIYDLAADKGLTIFGGIRPGCWLNLIAANGLLMFPEASSGCTCSFPLKCTVAMKHKKAKMLGDWTVFSTHGNMTPVKQLAVNLGAPGDMRDDRGTLWFGYPRPQIWYGVKFDLDEQILKDMKYFYHDFKGVHIEGTDKPWLFTSGCLGLLRCELPLIDEIWEQPGVYTVRLGFAALSGDRSGQRVFDVRLQDNVVLEKFDILEAAGAPNKAVIKQFNGIKVKDKLTIEFVPKMLNPAVTQVPIVNFIEVVREDTRKVSEVSKDAGLLNERDAEVLLESAKAELGEKGYEKTLEIYHAVFDTFGSVDLKLQALKGMTAIGNPKSLEKIERYCRDVSPILWNYNGPDPEIRDGAVEVYVSIANNMAKVDKQKSIKMLNYALTIETSLDNRQHVVDSLKNLGVEVDADASKPVTP